MLAEAQPDNSPLTRLCRRLAGKHDRFLGIDLSVDRARISELCAVPSRGSRQAALAWQSGFELSLPIAMATAPPSDWVDVLVETLNEQLPRCVDGDRVAAVIALPIPWIHYQTTDRDSITAVQSQCDAMFDQSIFRSPAFLAHWAIGPDHDRLMVAATAHSAACEIAFAVAEAGFDVQAVLPHGAALLHAAPALTTSEATAMVHLELTGGLVALRQSDGCGLCRNLPGCSPGAEQRPQLDELEPWIRDVAEEINATARYAARLDHPVQPQSPLLISGAATEIPGIDLALAAALARPVALWRYAGRFRPRHRLERGDDAAFALSLSLAYCAAQQFPMFPRSVTTRSSTTSEQAG